MILRLWRRTSKFLASAGFAIGLLIFIGVWSSLATVIAQGGPSVAAVRTWSASYPMLEPSVSFLGLHQAFTALPFLVAVVLLAISTAVCAWRRTIVARHRARILRAARVSHGSPAVGGSNLILPFESSLASSEVLTRTTGVLRRLGIRVVERDDRLVGASAPWTVWGSAVFHWSLVALIAAALLGTMVRSERTMALAVGQTKPDVASSYSHSSSTPVFAREGSGRSIRVDAFEPDYRVGGIARGAVPTVSILDSDGDVLVSQRVYQNNMLHSGSLAVFTPECGLVVRLTFLDEGGEKVGDDIRYVGFSQRAPQGTVPLGVLARRDQSGVVTMRLSATVPLDRAGSGFGEWIPKVPAARLVISAADGTGLADKVVRRGETISLPGGGAVRVDDIGWFSWLTVVDDPTIPLVYAAMIVAILGSTITLVARQHLVVATLRRNDGDDSLVVDLRLWRNVPTTRDEIESELRRALQSDTKECTV